MHKITLGKIASLVEGECIGDANITVTGIAPLGNAFDCHISFLFDPRYKNVLPKTNAAAVLLTKDNIDNCPVNKIVVSNPYLAYAIVSQEFDNAPKPEKSVHPSAIIADTVKIGKNISIGANTAIYDGVVIGDDVVIGSNCVIKENVEIGSNSYLHDNISIYHSCILGMNVRIHSGAVIGSDGFGIVKDKGKWHKIAQLGTVVIHDDVEIGSNTTIDRGAIDDTVLHSGVKLDNQIQVGHNVVIGSNTAIAGCVGIAGSSSIGKDCLIGGAAGISGHLKIADNVNIAAFTGVKKHIKKPGIYSSTIGCLEHREWSRLEARLKKLDGYIKLLKNLHKIVDNKEECNAN
jgi:UDP-3-O-[3-hydroxymyristoyl] glucosamine N-acyltransferase